MPTDEPPDRDEVVARLKELGVIIAGDHFVYTKGGHGEGYVAKDKALTDPWLAAAVAYHIATNLVIEHSEATLVGPAMAGIALVHLVANAALRMRPDHRYRVIYADKEGNGFVIKRGYEEHVGPGNIVIGVEDVINTGGSARDMKGAVEAHGGFMSSLGCICDRGGGATVGVERLYAFMTVLMQQFPAQTCPYCAEGRPVNTKFGHGTRWVAEHGQPPYSR